MRNRTAVGLAALAVLFLAFTDQASPQEVFFGVGATVPMGDYKDFASGDGAKTGIMAIGGVSFPIYEERLSVYGEGFVGRNGHDYEGDSSDLYGATGGALYDFARQGEPGIYVFGQVGLMVHKEKSEDFPEFETSHSGLAFGGGAGFSFPFGGIGAWIEGRYMRGQFEDWNTSFFGGMAGISIPLGRN